jgi:hypothetical protein
MTTGKSSQTEATSSKEEKRPKENLTKELANADLPKAATTWDGSKEPAEQAEPLEAQMPSTSKPASREKLSAPETTNETVLTKQLSLGLTNSQPGSEAIKEHKRSFKGKR